MRAGGPIKLYVDIAPLLDAEWTGIPMVAANLAHALLRAAPEEVVFFHEGSVAPTSAVQAALARFGGWALIGELSGVTGDVRGLDPLVEPGRTTIGLFPTVKGVRGVFDVECSIVHDLSTIVTPQFHVAANIDLHAQTLQDDLDTNALTVCVSEATRDDVAAYFGCPAETLSVALNGVSWPKSFEVRAANEFAQGEVEPYILVLGTREPRKNLGRVFDLLTQFPHLLDRYRFVFTGRVGWLEDETTPEALTDAFVAGRLLFTGFVTEYQKFKLLRGATAMIYPSVFEGFGLPVLEALSVGTPCITSRSSSLREVGGEVCSYFDPFSVKELHTAVRAIQALDDEALAALRGRCRERAERFTWDTMAGDIFRALGPAVAAAQARKRAS